jgi:ATP-dependent Zn protease
MKNNGKSIIVWIVAIVLMIVCISALFTGTGAKEISYDKMYGMFLKEEVVKYQIDRNQTIYLETKDGTVYQHDLADPEYFRQDLGELVLQQYQSGILKEFDYESTAVSIWVQLLPYILIIGVFCVM